MNYFLKLLFLDKYGRGTEEIKYLDEGVKNSNIILNHKTEIKPIHLPTYDATRTTRTGQTCKYRHHICHVTRYYNEMKSKIRHIDDNTHLPLPDNLPQ